MSGTGDSIACAGCGLRVPDSEPYPFRCPNAGERAADPVDHLLTPAVDLTDIKESDIDVSAENPFLRFRRLLYSYRLGRRLGVGDGAYVDLVNELDARVAAIDGRGFARTPYRAAGALAEELGLGSAGGGLWIKDETGNVAGSHKARHLMGVAIHLDIVERAGLAPRRDRGPRLAIASCGNAALAAAVVARAADRPLDVFLPPWAAPSVVARLEALGATLTRCERTPDSPPGDPCYHAFRRAVAGGALPFACQGSENGLTIEGGKTLAWELCAQHAATGAPPLDAIAVQVGGGALASAVAQGMSALVSLGAIEPAPRLYPVQAAGAAVLIRAWRRVAERALAALTTAGAETGARPEDDRALARRLTGAGPDDPACAAVASALAHATSHRPEYMWPWEGEPQSLATGILDDETYDWMAIVRATLATGGFPVVASEDAIAAAHARGRAATSIDASATGTAGLAGVISLRDAGLLDPGQRWAVLFTGATR